MDSEWGSAGDHRRPLERIGEIGRRPEVNTGSGRISRRRMPSKIEDYAIIGDTKTVALVDLTGSIDWWCAPRIDSAAAFAALLGDAGNGRWLIAPKGEVTKVTRHYEPETLILETIFETGTGSVSV